MPEELNFSWPPTYPIDRVGYQGLEVTISNMLVCGRHGWPALTLKQNGRELITECKQGIEDWLTVAGLTPILWGLEEALLTHAVVEKLNA